MEEPKTQPETPVTPEVSPSVPTVTPPVVKAMPLGVGTVQKLPQRSASSKKAMILLICLIALSLGGVGYYLLAKNNTQKSVAVAVKHDIPLITVDSGERGFNSFYPDIDSSSNFISPNRQIFEGLVRYDKQSKIVPLLGTSWTNPDTSTWDFTLKTGVKFHTGKVMTADDVKASIDAAKDSVFGQEFNTTIKSVTVLSANKIEIKTDGPDPILLNRLTSLWVFDTKSGKKNDPVNGTGPYVVKPGTTPSNDKLELVAFDDYHGGHVYTRGLNFSFIAGDDVASDFNTGAANFITFAYGGDYTKVTRAHAKQQQQSLAVSHLILNTRRKDSPLAKLKVRQAILVGTDPIALAKVRELAGIPAGQILPPTVPGSIASVKRAATDVSKAKAMLAEAGYPNGFSLTYTFFSVSTSTANELARQFKEIGITLKLDPQSVTKDLADKVYGGKTDMSFNTVSTDLFDGSDVLSLYLDSPNYTNPKAKSLLAEANKTLDQTARLKLLQQLEQIEIDDVIDIPLYIPAPSFQVYDPSFVVSNDIPGGNEIGVYFWKFYAK